MKITDIVALVNAGWTKDEIMSIVNGDQKQLDDKAETPGEKEIDVQPVQEEVKPEVVEDDRIKKLETKLDYVINRFNYMEVKNSKQPETEKTETVDDILAKMIR